LDRRTSDTRRMQIDANGNLILGTDGGVFRLPTPTGNTGVWSAIVGDISVFELHSIAYDHFAHVIMAGTQDNGTQLQQTAGGTTWTLVQGGDGGDVVIDDVSLAASGRSVRYFSFYNLGGWTRQVYDSANNLVSTTALASITDGSFTTPVDLNNVDPTRLLVGGTGHIYTSSNQGTSLTAIANQGVNSIAQIPPNGGGGMMVYGGFQGGVADADLIYAASGSNVLKQTTAGGGFTTLSPGGDAIRGVTDNPSNWATVFAIDTNQVFESTNAGASWVDVTANLTSVSAADFRSIQYVHGKVDDALVVGSSSGAFYARVSGLGAGGAWSKFGANLPDVIVYDLAYDATDNVLVAGTMGRGAWLVNNATTNLGIDNATIVWATSASGNFAAAANWNPVGVPGASSDVQISPTGTYTVTSTANETINSLTTAAGATLLISAGNFTINNGTDSGANAGTILVGAGSTLALTGSVTNSGLIEALGGSITLNGGPVTGSGLFKVGSGGSVNATGNGYLFHGAGGSELVIGTGNLNQAFSDSGNALLYFNGSQNQLFGGSATDWLGVTGNNNALVGGAGNDFIGATGNSDTLAGGSGNQTLFANGNSNYLAAGTGQDWLGASGNQTQIFGGAGADWMGITGSHNAISAGSGNSTLFANGSFNTLFGSTGNDWLGVSGTGSFLFGGSGNDFIAATGSSNTLDPYGAGTDTLFAAPNAHDHDTFVYHPGYGKVTINNFVPQVGDVINIAGFGITNVQGFAPYVSTSADGSIVLNLGGSSQLTLEGIPGGLQNSWFNFHV